MNHWANVMKKVGKGKSMGNTVKHFLCNYCPKDFQDPSTGTILKHLRKLRCPDLLPTKRQISSRDFFDKAKMKEPFNEDVFMGKRLKWIVKTDQPFSVVDNFHFEDLLEYLKKDIGVKSRRTIMRRLYELYDQKKHEMKELLNGFKSKYSIT